MLSARYVIRIARHESKISRVIGRDDYLAITLIAGAANARIRAYRVIRMTNVPRTDRHIRYWSRALATAIGLL